MNPEPALSVVITTPDTYETVRLTMRHLRVQSVRHQIELVIVGPTEEAISPEKEELAGFWGHKLVAAGTVTSIGRANAAGVRRASAPIVALAEDHCFPAPGWAEALIAAHRAPWAVVGPVMRNANPLTMISWSDFVAGYGPWMYPVAPGPAAFLPGHNSSYKKSLLLDYGDRLEELMEAEMLLHLDLRQRGHQLYLEPRAQATHTNFALAASWYPVQFYAGRAFGASRARPWSVAKRLLYFAASPLIPVVRLWRCLRELAKPGRPVELIPRILPALCLGLAIDGFGQMMGYLLGAGNAVERMSQYEFHRFRHVTDADRRAAEEQVPA
jgi:hypothetical protein